MAGRHQANKVNTMNGILINTKTYVEEFQSSIIEIRLNKNATMVDVSGDCFSVNSMKENMQMLRQLKNILANSEVQTNLKYLNDENDDKTVKLPKLKYRLTTEKKDMIRDTASLRKAFSSMMNCQGFGRNGRLRYGEGLHPVWWDNKQVPWNKHMNGVNPPANWKGLDKGPWTKALYEQISNCYLHYMTREEADEYTEQLVDRPSNNIDNVVLTEFEHTSEEHASDSSLMVDCTLGGLDMDALKDLSISRLLELVEPEEAEEPEEPEEPEETEEPVEKVKKTKKNLLQQTISKCPLCGKMVVTQKLLIEHMKTIHDVVWKSKERVEKPKEADLPKENELNCTVCGKMYKTAVWLKKHKESLNH